MTGAAFHRGQSDQEVRTPPEFIQAVQAELGPLAWDLAASPGNAVVPRYLTAGEDSLTVDWHRLRPRSWLWCNPPFNQLARWAAKAQVESEMGAQVALLCPAVPGRLWWERHVHQYCQVAFLRPRLTFVGHQHPFPQDLALLTYRESRPVRPVYEYWRWR